MAAHRTEFDVDASDEQVWAVLTDFERWGAWNPSVPSISGEVREGSTVSLTLAMFAIEPLAANKVRVTPVEDLRGWIAPLFEKLRGGAVQAHHDALNDALKRRAEALAAAPAAAGG
jgi:hypothetical protein